MAFLQDSKALFGSLLGGGQDDSDSDGSSPDSPPSSPAKAGSSNGSPSPNLSSVLNSATTTVVSSSSGPCRLGDLPALYRIGGQSVVSLAGSGSGQAAATMLPGSQPSLGTIMYQTPQGLLYAAPSGGSLPEALLLNLSQSVALKTEGEGTPAHQYITIPVPVSMAQQQQMSAGQSSSGSSRKDRTNK